MVRAFAPLARRFRRRPRTPEERRPPLLRVPWSTRSLQRRSLLGEMVARHVRRLHLWAERLRRGGLPALARDREGHARLSGRSLGHRRRAAEAPHGRARTHTANADLSDA